MSCILFLGPHTNLILKGKNGKEEQKQFFESIELDI